PAATADWPAAPAPLAGRDPVHGHLVDLEQAASGQPQGVEGPGLDQRLDDPLVEHADVDLVAEVEEVGETALLPPGGDDRLDDLFTDVPHRAQAIADAPVPGALG